MKYEPINKTPRLLETFKKGDVITYFNGTEYGVYVYLVLGEKLTNSGQRYMQVIKHTTYLPGYKNYFGLFGRENWLLCKPIAFKISKHTI